MAPGGEMFRYPQHFGENVLPHGSHEWLPYSKDEVRLKVSTLKNAVIASQCSHWRGNPPDEWNQVTITTRNRKVFPFCRAIVDTFPF